MGARKTLLRRQRASLQLGEEQASGIVTIASVAGVKPGFLDETIQRVVGKIVSRLVFVDEGFEPSGSVILIAQCSAFGIGAGQR
ncbi:hypothetical protein SDC9_94274 [bioreactor metagenome]|uniref:Uncharacterized protein n=1 Tax=bioreactor metagenome TaxID=1076179 RepID=A0A645A9P2_9ZZZZ